MGDNGRPSYSEEQYKVWLNLMTPFLVSGNSLSYAITKAGLTEHRTTLYEKSKLGDWFSDKIDDLQRIPGEITNETFSLLIRKINRKVKAGEDITRDDFQILKHFSEKHRTSQLFFVNRHEIVPPSPTDVSRVLDEIENKNWLGLQKTDYGELADYAKEELERMNASQTTN